MIDRIHNMIKRSKNPPASVITLLNNTLIGTEGSLYQLLDTETKINSLHQPNFIYLERNDKAIANVTICERSVTINGAIENGLYGRYFAFDKLFQSSGHKGENQQNKKSAFQYYFTELFKSSNFNPSQPEHNKTLYWGFIDPQNSRSFQMNERFGFQTIGHFKTIAFSRVNPKVSANVSRLKETERVEVLETIKDFYTGFNFFSEAHLFDNDDFFVLKENGKIIAGIQANPVSWRIKSLPGTSGKFLVKFAHRIPRLKKLINPSNHQFLATEGVFWKDGYENRVQELLEGVLALSNKNSLLIWADTNNKQFDNLAIKWGFIQKTKKDNQINIVAKFIGFNSKEIEQIRTGKKYLSGFDMT